MMGILKQMFGRRSSLIASTAIVGAGLFALAPAADAAPIFQIRVTSSLGGTATISDNLGGDTATDLNQIVANIPVNGFVNGVDINVALTNSPGSTDIASIQINNTALRNNVAGPVTLTIEATATDFALPTGPGLYLQSTASGNVTNLPGIANISYSSFANPNNLPFSTAGIGSAATPLQSVGVPDSSPGVASYALSQATVGFSTSTLYSLTSVASITLNGTGGLTQFTGTSVVVPVPEPAIAGIIGVGSLLLAARRRRI